MPVRVTETGIEVVRTAGSTRITGTGIEVVRTYGSARVSQSGIEVCAKCNPISTAYAYRDSDYQATVIFKERGFTANVWRSLDGGNTFVQLASNITSWTYVDKTLHPGDNPIYMVTRVCTIGQGTITSVGATIKFYQPPTNNVRNYRFKR